MKGKPEQTRMGSQKPEERVMKQKSFKLARPREESVEDREKVLLKGKQIIESENVLVENIENLLKKYQENLTDTLTRQMGLDIN